MDLVGDVDDGLDEGLVPFTDGAGELGPWSVGALEDLIACDLVDELSWST